MTNVTTALPLPAGPTGRFYALLLVACASVGQADLAAQTIDGVLLARGTD